MRSLFRLCWVVAVTWSVSSASLWAASYDVVVVGATPAGVAAAVNAAREGVTVALVEETGHIGGLASGGLSNTDFRTFPALGGTFREFMHRVEQHYVKTHGPNSQPVIDSVRGGYYEPSVARRVFEEMLREQARITVLLHHRLQAAEVEPAASFRRLRSAQFVNLGTQATVELEAKVFIDATYEGDLVGVAGVPYRLGCESKYEYNEDLSQFEESNRYVQTYNFRVCLSRDPANRLPIPKPAGYQEEDYLPLLEHFRRGTLQSFANPDPKPILKVRPMANLKADFNDEANAPISLSLKNINHAWPEGSPEVRARIYQRYKDYSLGLFWFLANHPGVPEKIRQQMQEWGLPKDEYVDTDHWSPALYVREGRRIVGEYVFTQHDTQPMPGQLRARLHRNSVGIGDYSLNCHGVYSPAPGINVGRHGRQVRPFQMPYQIMVPVEMDALLVPVAVSSSHVGYSAIRMEPAWTALGQAAGIAAALVVKEGTEVRTVDVGQLQDRLHAVGAFTVYITDLFPGQQVPRPAWDPPGFFEAPVPPWPSLSDHSIAAQYFGTQGFFHHLKPTGQRRSLATRGPSGRSTGQWGTEFKDHEVELDLPIDAALAAQWLKLAQVSPQPRFAADGRLTRGEFLNRLYAHVKNR